MLKTLVALNRVLESSSWTGPRLDPTKIGRPRPVDVVPSIAVPSLFHLHRSILSCQVIRPSFSKKQLSYYRLNTNVRCHEHNFFISDAFSSYYIKLLGYRCQQLRFRRLSRLTLGRPFPRRVHSSSFFNPFPPPHSICWCTLIIISDKWESSVISSKLNYREC